MVPSNLFFLELIIVAVTVAAVDADVAAVFFLVDSPKFERSGLVVL